MHADTNIEGDHECLECRRYARDLAARRKTITELESKLQAALVERDQARYGEQDLQNQLDSAHSRLHQLSEDHSHCEGLLHELGERASRAESRLRTLAIGIVGARMAHVEEDYSEAYHLLYSAARALSDDPHEPWKAVDALADGAIERRDGQTFVNLPKDAERHPDDIDGDGICPINCESPEVRCGLPVGHGGPHRVVEKDDAWDREIAADAAAGKLDGLRAEAAAVVEKPEQNSHAGCRYCNGSGWRIVNNSFEDCPRPKSE